MKFAQNILKRLLLSTQQNILSGNLLMYSFASPKLNVSELNFMLYLTYIDTWNRDFILGKPQKKLFFWEYFLNKGGGSLQDS